MYGRRLSMYPRISEGHLRSLIHCFLLHPCWAQATVRADNIPELTLCYIKVVFFPPNICSGRYLETQHPKFKSGENKDLFVVSKAFYCNWLLINNLLIREDENFSHLYQVNPVRFMPWVLMASTNFPFVISLDINIV